MEEPPGHSYSSSAPSPSNSPPQHAQTITSSGSDIDGMHMQQKRTIHTQASLLSIADKTNPEDLGVVFCTRAACSDPEKADDPLQRARRRSHSGLSLTSGLSMPSSKTPRLGVPSYACLIQQALQGSAVFTAAYVVGSVGVEPFCGEARAGKPSWWRAGWLPVLHAVNSIIYLVLGAVSHRLLRFYTRDFRRGPMSPWYLSSSFWCDVISAAGCIAEFLHLQEPLMSFPSAAHWCMLFSLTRTWRIIISDDIIMPSMSFWQGIVSIFLHLLFVAHCMACCLLTLGAYELHIGEPSWVTAIMSATSGGCGTVYSEALYFAVLSLGSVGYGDSLITPPERSLNTLFLLLSQLYCAKVCADLTWKISLFNNKKASFMAMSTQTKLSLQHMGAPNRLTQRVMAFQSYVASCCNEDLSQPVFAGLSENLMKELQLVVYRELVLQAPFMRDQSKEVILLIVGSLRDTVYLPADIIMRHGGCGRDLFFVRRGTAAVFAGAKPPHWLDDVVTTLEVGAYFGEMGMLTGRPRTAWVMAKSYCICARLPYDGINKLSDEYPGAFTTLVQSMVRSYKLTSTTTWKKLFLKLVHRKIDSPEKAFSWFCSQGDDEDEMDAKTFDKALRKLGVPDMDRRVLWADIDGDNTGAVTFQKFQDKMVMSKLENGDGGKDKKEESRCAKKELPPLIPALDKDTNYLENCSSTGTIRISTSNPADVSFLESLHSAVDRSMMRLSEHKIEAREGGVGGGAGGHAALAQVQKMTADCNLRIDRQLKRMANQARTHSPGTSSRSSLAVPPAPFY
eukprot:TRINITY_DN17811_c0_g1_i2.p1 TRINITY_DN17811_c0_g1~~TRINITY_DN17811_c0_g1_i2.p1  ORF type:complete len:791 (+),score=101.21 TRINITY_DN17811_c0_g1_i2:134-2506(+)